MDIRFTRFRVALDVADPQLMAEAVNTPERDTGDALSPAHDLARHLKQAAGRRWFNFPRWNTRMLQSHLNLNGPGSAYLNALVVRPAEGDACVFATAYSDPQSFLYDSIKFHPAKQARGARPLLTATTQERIGIGHKLPSYGHENMDRYLADAESVYPKYGSLYPVSDDASCAPECNLMGFEAIAWNSPWWYVPLRSAGEDMFSATSDTPEAIYSSTWRVDTGAQDNPLFKLSSTY